MGDRIAHLFSKTGLSGGEVKQLLVDTLNMPDPDIIEPLTETARLDGINASRNFPYNAPVEITIDGETPGKAAVSFYIVRDINDNFQLVNSNGQLITTNELGMPEGLPQHDRATDRPSDNWITIGRNVNADIAPNEIAGLRNKALSGTHVKIRVHKNGVVEVRNIGVNGGTSVVPAANYAERIQPKTPPASAVSADSPLNPDYLRLKRAEAKVKNGTEGWFEEKEDWTVQLDAPVDRKHVIFGDIHGQQYASQQKSEKQGISRGY